MEKRIFKSFEELKVLQRPKNVKTFRFSKKDNIILKEEIAMLKDISKYLGYKLTFNNKHREIYVTTKLDFIKIKRVNGILMIGNDSVKRIHDIAMKCRNVIEKAIYMNDNHISTFGV